MEKKLLTVFQVAEYLQVHVNTVRRYVKEDGLPVASKIPQRFRIEQIDEWLENRGER